MKTAGKMTNQSAQGAGRGQWGALGRSVIASLVLVVGLAGNAQAAPATAPAVAESVAAATTPAAPTTVTPVAGTRKISPRLILNRPSNRLKRVVWIFPSGVCISTPISW